MREIKFRVWDNDLKKMEYNPCVPYGDGINDAIKFYGDNIMHFTDLKDKNRKEIFKSDLVKQHYIKGIMGEKSNETIIGVVVKDDYIGKTSWGGWKIKYPIAVFPLASLYGGVSELEVIGNIHENPDLL